MKLYRVNEGIVIDSGAGAYSLGSGWDELINRNDLFSYLRSLLDSRDLPSVDDDFREQILSPIVSQEVWAAGVTYYRSRTARIEESQNAGGGDFYDRVYTAERPELFFKATPQRVAGPGGTVRIRRDSQWNVPEPELALVITRDAKIVGYTIGNDMSSRDIEGTNPLYLPQAKVYDKSCALGPCVYVSEEMLPATTEVKLSIKRNGETVFDGETVLAQLKRSPESLVEFLFRDNSFPSGCVLLTGTGIVPQDDFTLQHGDEIGINIEPIGTLVNVVE
ncbi:MAG: 2-hydroxyhepta-2,4-diene-1,7-dioate isomerase [Blastocatellia bacterium]|nr:MAG: 2-hydroxyhepta-2,4-diene-1,7-dioate isomerase [Blastocatellia bacterium]